MVSSLLGLVISVFWGLMVLSWLLLVGWLLKCRVMMVVVLKLLVFDVFVDVLVLFV